MPDVCHKIDCPDGAETELFEVACLNQPRFWIELPDPWTPGGFNIVTLCREYLDTGAVTCVDDILEVYVPEPASAVLIVFGTLFLYLLKGARRAQI